MNTNPLRTLLIFLVVFLALVGFTFENLQGYFLSNVFINGIVVTAGIIGLGYILQANLRLQKIIDLFKQTDNIHSRSFLESDDMEDDEEANWDAEFEADEYAELLEEKGNCLKWIMSAKDVQTIKDWSPDNLFSHDQVETALSAVRLRIAEVRNFSNYFSGILIILGLLGTFIGLLETIKAIGLVFSGDSISFLVEDKAETSSEDILEFFDAISEPLAGMGIAFSSSLFGLSGSLIVGLFAFISARNQSFFLFDLFDWFKNRMDFDEAQALDRSVMTSLPSSSGLMGSLVRGGLKLPQGQSLRSLGSGYAAAAYGRDGAGPGGDFRGEFKGEFKGQGEISGKFDADALMGVLERLEALSRDAIDKNGLLAKAALKLGENLALEQKRLADIATYEQQAAVSLAALRQQGEHQIHLLNQQIEAAHSSTDKEEFRALAAHFHRSFETLLGDVRAENMALHDKISKIGIAGVAAMDESQTEGDAYVQQTQQVQPPSGPGNPSNNGYVASIRGQQVNPLSPSNDEDKS